EDSAHVGVRRKRAEGAAPVATEARRAEAVRHRLRCMRDEQRSLERQRQPLDQPARAAFLGTDAERLQRIDVRIESPVAAPGLLELGEERLYCVRLLAQRAEDVEAGAGARTCPDRVQRRFAIKPG